MYLAQAQTHFYYTNMQTKQQKNIQNERRETTNEPMWITKVLALWILAISVEIAGATFFLSIGQGEQHIICMKFQCNFRYTIIIDDSPGNSTFTDLLTWVISPYWIQGFKDRECHTLTYWEPLEENVWGGLRDDLNNWIPIRVKSMVYAFRLHRHIHWLSVNRVFDWLVNHFEQRKSGSWFGFLNKPCMKWNTLQLPHVGAKLQSMKLMSLISVFHNLMSVGGLKIQLTSPAPSSSW